MGGNAFHARDKMRRQAGERSSHNALKHRKKRLEQGRKPARCRRKPGLDESPCAPRVTGWTQAVLQEAKTENRIETASERKYRKTWPAGSGRSKKEAGYRLVYYHGKWNKSSFFCAFIPWAAPLKSRIVPPDEGKTAAGLRFEHCGAGRKTRREPVLTKQGLTRRVFHRGVGTTVAGRRRKSRGALFPTTP